MQDNKFKVRFATSIARAEIEHWLNANCGGRWSIRFVGADDHDSAVFRMVFETCFEREWDCRTFRQTLSRADDDDDMPIITSYVAFLAATDWASARHS